MRACLGQIFKLFLILIFCLPQTTAVEVQNLLVSGRRKEALQRAQEGQLWGPALVLAAQLGDKVCATLLVLLFL